MLMRFCLTKEKEIYLLSHLDYVRAVERALRRSQLEVAYTEGFNPHMKLSFATALSLGVTSSAEYADIGLLKNLTPEYFLERVNNVLPRGIVIKKSVFLEKKEQALSSMVNAVCYLIRFEKKRLEKEENLNNVIEKINLAEAIIFERKTPKNIKKINLKDFLETDLKFRKLEKHYEIEAWVKVLPVGSVKPQEIWREILCLLKEEESFFGDCENLVYYHRTGLYKKTNGKFEPLI